MSAQQHCPTKKELHEAREKARAAGAATGAPGRPWRSLDEVADTPDFREFLEREFPAGASELREETTRRDFLKIMGASVALAGAATIPGCRRPDHKIMPYSAVVPEDAIPGKPMYYATSMPLPGGGAEGLLAETHDGRPTKLEGNPFHPINKGKSSVWAQASILGLYDPDRLKYPVYRGVQGQTRVAAWDDFKSWAKEHLSHLDTRRGQGLAVLVEKRTSHTRDAMRERFMQRFPQAMWVAYDPTEAAAPYEGSAIAFGAPMRDQLQLTQNGRMLAKVIVSLDRDFLDQEDPANVSYQRQWADTRRALNTRDDMSRLYVVEPGFSLTGACADHRLRMAPSRIPAFAVSLARAVLAKVGEGIAGPLAQALAQVQVPAGEDLNEETSKFIAALADDLTGHAVEGGQVRRGPGETLIVCGKTQPAAVHALCYALNAALGNIERTIQLFPLEGDSAANSMHGLQQLARAAAGGQIDTLVCIETNPLYDAPPELNFADAFKKVANTITLSCCATETAAASAWSLNGTHYLEAWGDTIAWDGTVAPIQPMIAPLYGPAFSDIEFLAILADPNGAIAPPEPVGQASGLPAGGTPAPPLPPPPPMPRVDDGHRILRETWARVLGGNVQDPRFDKAFKRALHDGVLRMNPAQPAQAQANFGAVAQAVSQLQIAGAPTQQALDVCFFVGNMADGRYANNGWLMELPQPGSRVVWDNPALISPATAKALGLLPEDVNDKFNNTYTSEKYPSGRIGNITVNGRQLRVAFWVLPGMADNTIALQFGWGRTVAGLVGDGVGFNVFQVCSAASRRMARGAVVETTREFHPISSTQNHWTLEGRDSIVRQVDLAAWQKHGGEEPHVESDPLYGTEKTLNFGERVGHGELSHSPPINNIYPHPFMKDGKAPGTLKGRTTEVEAGAEYASRQQWGMSIDLSTCTGCGACTIACQAENNIPIVGKKEVQKGREMHWIRVDRYFSGNPHNPSEMLHQPVPCMHCDNAPCETVCPVNATVQGPEGNNYQVYNRCIGTRYCENNCPYKVRRFNFFDYGVTKFNGGYIGQETVDGIVPDRGGITGSGAHNKVNPNLIPPRLREKLNQIERMQKNPDVTVRSRGVMEKCTYCIQRINEARIETKIRHMTTIPDGFIQTACQQACPTDAIVFGDITDSTGNGGKGSRMHQLRHHPRTYMLLGFLNTRPRTTHMVRVVNPNPRIRPVVEDPFGHGGGHGGEGTHDQPHDTGGDSTHGTRSSAHPMSRSTFLRDSTKKLADRGYALSLKVLSPLI
jgi:MoCo/4Fe-4S cofactor protein with predicted Tat translocation signal